MIWPQMYYYHYYVSKVAHFELLKLSLYPVYFAYHINNFQISSLFIWL